MPLYKIHILEEDNKIIKESPLEFYILISLAYIFASKFISLCLKRN